MHTQSATSFKSLWSRLTAAAMLTVLLLTALPVAAVFAAETGFASPSFAATTGKTAWTNPTYSFASDDQYASTALQKKQLTLSFFNIDPIQGNSTINGIVVTVEGHTDGRQVQVEISGDGGTTWASPKQTALGATDSVDTRGGASDLWGGTWTPANFTNAQFKVRLISTSTSGTVFIDHVQAKVYFQPPDTTLTVDPVSENYGALTTTLSATLTETEGGTPISGKTVDFTLNGVSVGNAVTDASGVASLPGVSIGGLASGTYADAIFASFAGDLSYDPTSGIADLTIVGIPLTVTAHPQTRHYGYPNPDFTWQLTSGALLPGDSITGSLSYEPLDETLGDHAIVQGSLTAGPGYTITFVGDFLTIDQAPLTVTAVSLVKLDTDPAISDFAFTYGDFVLGEDPSVLTTAPTCDVPPGTDQSAPGSYPIACSGGVADNYTFVYVDGTLTVNAVPSDITLTPVSISENRPSGTAVGTLTTTDPLDTVFNYSLQNNHPEACSGVDNGVFTIDNAAGALKTAAMFNYEAKQTYTVCIETDDLHGGIFQKQFTITITDLPETFYSVSGQDGWILESTETSGIGGMSNYSQTTFNLGDDALNKQYRSILAFRTGGLPDKAVITKAVLQIRRQSIIGTNPLTTHKSIVADIRKGSFGAYNLQLADFNSTASLSSGAVFSKTLLTGGWYKANLRAAALLKVNALGVTQFRLRFQTDDDNDLVADYLKFYSGNSVLANRPVLVLQYYVP